MTSDPTAWVVVDLGFGDAGKGTITDFLVRDRGAELVVRYNGGAQAGHNVVTPDGRHHTFSQFGAGHLAGAATLLGPAFLLHPLGMAVEAEALSRVGPDPWPRTWVDARCRVISPFHQAVNRAREWARGDAAHGSCGIGVGACVADALDHPDDVVRAAELADGPTVRRRLARQRDRLRAEVVALGVRHLGLFDDRDLIDRVVAAWGDVARRLQVLDPDAVQARIDVAPRVVFEGAQGVLLDETWGFHPHTTWSDTTATHALALAGRHAVTRLGVLRAYASRHGQGPFPTEGTLRAAEPHNRDDGFQGRFRTGVLDLVLLRYALEVCPVDGLAVTWLDRGARGVCRRYAAAGPAGLVDGGRLVPGPADDLGHRERLGAWLRGVRPVVEDADPVAAAGELGPPVVLVSAGPTAADKRWVGEPSCAA